MGTASLIGVASVYIPAGRNGGFLVASRNVRNRKKSSWPCC